MSLACSLLAGGMHALRSEWPLFIIINGRHMLIETRWVTSSRLWLSHGSCFNDMAVFFGHNARCHILPLLLPTTFRCHILPLLLPTTCRCHILYFVATYHLCQWPACMRCSEGLKHGIPPRSHPPPPTCPPRTTHTMGFCQQSQWPHSSKPYTLNPNSSLH